MTVLRKISAKRYQAGACLMIDTNSPDADSSSDEPTSTRPPVDAPPLQSKNHSGLSRISMPTCTKRMRNHLHQGFLRISSDFPLIDRNRLPSRRANRLARQKIFPRVLQDPRDLLFPTYLTGPLNRPQFPSPCRKPVYL